MNRTMLSGLLVSRFVWMRASTAVIFFMGLAALLVMPSALLATPLPPGVTLYPAPGPVPAPGGAVVAGGFAVPFASGLYSGTLTSTVLAGDPTNPLGGLTFTYLITNNPTPISTDQIERLTINNFDTLPVDGSFSVPGLPPSLAPTLIDRSISGGTIGFSFNAPTVGPGTLLPGMGSALLVLRTGAPAFTPTFASVIDGTVTTVASFAPMPVPEPSSAILCSIGVFAIGSVMRYRRTKKLD